MHATIHHELVTLLPRLRRFARGLTGSAEEADDLVQAACERAITRLHQWQPGTRLDSWMYRIIQTIRLDQLRANAVRQRHLEAVQFEQDEESGTGFTEMETHLTLDRVRAAMERLPEEQRLVLMLICVEGYSYKETAEVVGAPIGTVTSRLTRARLALERMLTPGNESPDSPAERSEQCNPSMTAP